MTGLGKYYLHPTIERLMKKKKSIIFLLIVTDIEVFGTIVC